MTRLSLIAALLAATALPASAEGDAARGEREFNKCRACHMIAADDGTEIFTGGRSGPNLHSVIGRAAAGLEGYRYSPSLIAAGEAGLVWDEETVVAFATDPTGFLRDWLEDNRARSNMAFRLPRGGEDIAAYLHSVAE